MTARVFLPVAWRDLSAGVAEVDIPGGTLRSVLKALDGQYPGVWDRACVGTGLRPGLAVAVDGAVTTRGLITPVPDGCEIHFLPAVGGG